MEACFVYPALAARPTEFGQVPTAAEVLHKGANGKRPQDLGRVVSSLPAAASSLSQIGGPPIRSLQLPEVVHLTDRQSRSLFQVPITQLPPTCSHIWQRLHSGCPL